MQYGLAVVISSARVRGCCGLLLEIAVKCRGYLPGQHGAQGSVPGQVGGRSVLFFVRPMGRRENRRSMQCEDDFGDALQMQIGAHLSVIGPGDTAGDQVLCCSVEALFMDKQVRPASQAQPMFVTPEMVLREGAGIF